MDIKEITAVVRGPNGEVDCHLSLNPTGGTGTFVPTELGMHEVRTSRGRFRFFSFLSFSTNPFDIAAVCAPRNALSLLPSATGRLFPRSGRNARSTLARAPVCIVLSSVLLVHVENSFLVFPSSRCPFTAKENSSPAARSAFAPSRICRKSCSPGSILAPSDQSSKSWCECSILLSGGALLM